QSSSDGTPFPKLLESKGVIPGIKVDTGAKPPALAEGETITDGPVGPRERPNESRELGPRFATSPATYSVSDTLPSEYCTCAHAQVLLPARAGGGARDRLPLGRPVRRGRDRAPERDERPRAAPGAALVLVRARVAGARAQGLGRQGRRGRPARLLPPREDELG